MDDVNNMDELIGMVEQPGGISRRDMIKASVVAGALVWSAPVLLTGRASANHVWPPDPADENCPCVGTLLRFKISSTIQSANCGELLCLDDRDPSLAAEVLCGDAEDAIVCAIKNDTLIRFVPPTDFNQGIATLELDPRITLVAIGVRETGGGQASCSFTDCGDDHLSIDPDEPDPDADPPDPPNPPNTDIDGDPLPYPNRIWVTPGPDGGQTIHIDLPGNRDVGQIDLLLCVSRAVTGMC